MFQDTGRRKRPALRKRYIKGPAVLIDQRPEKESADDIGHLTFRVSPEFKREYKTYAAAHDMSMMALLMASFQVFKTSRP